MASFAFDFDLVVALLKFILPTKNEEDERAVEFLASRFHETWLYVESDPSRLDDYFKIPSPQSELMRFCHLE